MLTVEKSRLAPPAVRETPLKTLGDVTRLLISQLQVSGQNPATKKNYAQQIEVLKKNWPEADFETTLPSSIEYDILLALRNRLKTARWKGHQKRRSGKGYSNAYINQVLARLNNILALARANHLCSGDPFQQRIGLQGDLLLPLNSKAPRLPSTAEMDRIFLEMVNVKQGPNEEPAFFSWRKERAIEASEHVRFLAYSGCRLAEANACKFEDDKGKTFHIRGTKSRPADREIPCVPAFRALLDEIKSRRIGNGITPNDRILVPFTSRDALKKACERLGFKKIGHHHLRHYFATVCIESGVDIPTVSRWLGHSDGGALAMRVYGHLRQEHSQAQPQKVNFGPKLA